MKVFKTALLGITLCCYAQTTRASEVFHRDTVSINGQVISIRADVEIDSLLMRSGSWVDDLDVAALFIMGTNFQTSFNEFDDNYSQSSYVRFPEIGLEINHPFFFSLSQQLNYRAGVSVGVNSTIDVGSLDNNLIGFHYNGQNINQITYISDDLGNEPDTIVLKNNLKPQVKFNLGIQWHGIMRQARGWRLGFMVEVTPVRNQLVSYNKLTLPADQWEDIDSESTYSIDDAYSSYFHLKMFYSWSPWNSPLFLRNSWIWSPNNLQTAITLGYHF